MIRLLGNRNQGQRISKTNNLIINRKIKITRNRIQKIPKIKKMKAKIREKINKVSNKKDLKFNILL